MSGLEAAAAQSKIAGTPDVQGIMPGGCVKPPGSYPMDPKIPPHKRLEPFDPRKRPWKPVPHPHPCPGPWDVPCPRPGPNPGWGDWDFPYHYVMQFKL